MKKVCFITATRAEYGLLKPLINALRRADFCSIEIAVTGMHLSPEFGMTYQQIEADNNEIAAKIPILLSSDTPAGISKTMGLAMIGFADYFEKSQPDLLVVLGDRYETLAICCAAMNALIPIAHLHGGETTEGAIDEACRHAITKMSWLHFTSTAEYRKRVIQLGEDPERVFAVGALGVENALHTHLFTREEISRKLAFELEKPYAIVTFHPVTLEGNSSKQQFSELIKAIDRHTDMNFIITGSNADADGRVINQMIQDYSSQHDNVLSIDSMGVVLYLSAMKYASFVLGNSSSGILESPSFGVPAINIGNRQKGRIQASNVINCLPDVESIEGAIVKATSEEFRRIAQNSHNPYGDGKTSEKIVKVIDEFFKKTSKPYIKSFYNI